MKRIMLLSVVMICLFGLFGCSDDDTQTVYKATIINSSGKNLAQFTYFPNIEKDKTDYKEIGTLANGASCEATFTSTTAIIGFSYNGIVYAAGATLTDSSRTTQLTLYPSTEITIASTLATTTINAMK